MPWLQLDEKTQVHVCRAKPRRKRCRWCSSWATRWCDGKKNPKRKGKDCDAPMCANHGVEVGRQVIDGKEQGVDWCPDCCLEDLKSRPAPR